MTRLIPIAACGVLLSACGTTDVIEMGKSVYTVTAQHGVLDGSWDQAARDAVAKARAFCAAKNETYIFVSEQRTGVPGYSQQRSQVTFRCGPNVVDEQTEHQTVDVQNIAPAAKPDLYTELMKLDDLHKRGLLTDDEFQAQKAKLLNAN
jgi:flavin-binding protein dodecin